MKHPGPIPTLERPLYLLSFFDEAHPYRSLSELARVSGLAKASCLRALRALERHGLVTREGERYRLGARLVTLGGQVQAAYPARRIALPYLLALRDATGQSVQWVVREGLEGIYLEVVEPTVRVRLYVAPGRRAPLYGGASTRLLLAYAPAEVRNAILAGERQLYTPATPIESLRLLELMMLSQRTGFAASFGELEAHSAEVAAAVFGPNSELVGVVSLAGAEVHYREPGVFRGFLEALLSSARAISQSLGFFGDRWDLLGFLAAHAGGKPPEAMEVSNV